MQQEGLCGSRVYPREEWKDPWIQGRRVGGRGRSPGLSTRDAARGRGVSAEPGSAACSGGADESGVRVGQAVEPAYP